MSKVKSIQDRVGQMLMGGFHGLTAPDYFLEWLHEGRLGGAILFARNVESPEQLAALTEQLHAAAKYPLLIGIDQEGGTVARLREGFSESPGAMALSAIAENADSVTEGVSVVLGREMAALGINWTYAPVVDVSYNAANPTVGTRSFGSDPARIAALATAATRGFQSGGVAACAKHFPGLGDTAVDTHLALPRLDTPFDHLLNVDLLPYRAVIDAGIASVMTTHTIFNALDAEHPATLSAYVIHRLLRDELGFTGVVTTDCMEMKAIDDHYGIADSTVRAANAGVDIVLISHTPEKQSTAYDALLAAVKEGRVSEETVNAANERIAAMKARFALNGTDVSQVATKEHHTITLDAARAALTCVREEADVLPMCPKDSRNIQLVEFVPGIDSDVQENTTQSPLAKLVKTAMPSVNAIALPTRPTQEQIAQVTAQLADVRVIATRNAHLNAAQAEAVRLLAESAPHVVLLALRNPYDANLIDGGTVICTLGDSTPSLEAAAEVLAGHVIPTGCLPVEV